MSDSEVWKDIVGYEGLYKVSDKGNIYSVERIGSQGNKWGGITLKPAITRTGYLQVQLYKNGIMERNYVHRIVAEAFITNPNNHPEINHIDEVKANNNVKNLEWCTKKYNINHGTRNERSAQANSKKVKAVNVETGEVITFNSAQEARGKGYPNVREACRGVNKSSNGTLIGDGHTYKGHKWSYE